MAENATVVYTLTVTNIDAVNTATAVEVIDNLPAEVTYVSNTCGADHTAGVVVWNVGSLAPSASDTCDVSVTVTGFGTIVNDATAAANETDNDTSNNSASATVDGPTPPSAVDLSLTKSVLAPNPLFTGTNITYTLTASSVGTLAATGVVVVDNLPSQVSYVSNDCGAAVAGNTVTWNIGNMNPAQVLTCDIVVTVDQDGSIINTATISSNETDVASGNNTGSAIVNSGALQVIPSLNLYGLMALLLGIGFVVRRRLVN